MRVNKCKTCQTSHDLDRSWMDRETGWCVEAASLFASPSLTIYSPYHHTYSMCISTVHYCCHRNVMRSASYRLTQLNGKPCLICSGIFILILKGHCKYSMKVRRRRGKERMTEQESRRRLDPPHLSSHHSFLSLTLMSGLSISSQCESVAIIYTSYSYIILRTYCYIFYQYVTLCVLVSLIGYG